MQEVRVGLLGFGTVGTGVVRVFQNNARLLKDRLGLDLKLVRIADLDIHTDRGVKVASDLLTTDAAAVLDAPDVDIVIELIGGYEPARSFVLRALQNRKHVVTANKALLALHGAELFAAAEEHGVEIMFEASVGGGIPVISALKENLCANHFQTIFGILNGTCNYILTRMTEEGQEFSVILKDAQAAGFAEADPTFDIEGIDTAHKLALLDIQFAHEFGYRLKLLAIGKCENGDIEARVHPTMIPEKYPLADVNGAFNAIRINGDFVGPVMLYGQGAGRDATASAVMGDVMALARTLKSGGGTRTPGMGYVGAAIRDLRIKPMDDIVGQYYLRFTTIDRPGVLAQIAGILGRFDISIASMIQPDRHAAEAVPIVITTHEAREANIRKALAEIDQLEIVREKTRLIRIENHLE